MTDEPLQTTIFGTDEPYSKAVLTSLPDDQKLPIGDWKVSIEVCYDDTYTNSSIKNLTSGEYDGEPTADAFIGWLQTQFSTTSGLVEAWDLLDYSPRLEVTFYNPETGEASYGEWQY